MIGPVVARFQWGQRVVALTDLVNDGSFPNFPEDALIVPTGGLGEIVQIGTHVDTNTPVYMVEFGPRLVVGCLEHEIIEAIEVTA